MHVENTLPAHPTSCCVCPDAGSPGSPDIRPFAVGHSGARGCDRGDGACDGQDASSHSLFSPRAQRSSSGHPGVPGKTRPKWGLRVWLLPSLSAPSAKPSCEPSLRQGEQRFPRSSGDVVYGCRRERSPRGSELPSSRRHACMNNRSSPDAGCLLCNFSRRLESLSRVFAEVTAYLSYSGRERQSSAGGDEMPARRHFLSSVGLAWRASERPLPCPLQLTRILRILLPDQQGGCDWR